MSHDRQGRSGWELFGKQRCQGKKGKEKHQKRSTESHCPRPKESDACNAGQSVNFLSAQRTACTARFGGFNYNFRRRRVVAAI